MTVYCGECLDKHVQNQRLTLANENPEQTSEQLSKSDMHTEQEMNLIDGQEPWTGRRCKWCKEPRLFTVTRDVQVFGNMIALSRFNPPPSQWSHRELLDTIFDGL